MFDKVFYSAINQILPPDVEFVPHTPTRERFELDYAKRSGLTLKELRELDRYAIPCHCNFEQCQGWQMVTKKEFDQWQSSIEDVDDDPDN